MRDKGFTVIFTNPTRGIPCVIYADRCEQKDSLGNIHRQVRAEGFSSEHAQTGET
jgi:hypothetical protein